jgi:hypothetical protein
LFPGDRPPWSVDIAPLDLSNRRGVRISVVAPQAGHRFSSPFGVFTASMICGG